MYGSMKKTVYLFKLIVSYKIQILIPNLKKHSFIIA